MPQFSDQVIKILDDLARRFGIVIDWTQANIMPYAQDLIHRIVLHKIWTSVFFMVIEALAIGVLAFFIRKDLKKWKEYWVTGICIALTIFLAVAFFVDIYNIITALTLPEHTLFQYYKALTAK